jgi:hypothetical protein
MWTYILPTQMRRIDRKFETNSKAFETSTYSYVDKYLATPTSGLMYSLHLEKDFANAQISRCITASKENNIHFSGSLVRTDEVMAALLTC